MLHTKRNGNRPSGSDDGQESPIVHTKFRGNRPPVPKKKIFEGFLLYIWAWRPSLSCDQHHASIFSYPCT